MPRHFHPCDRHSWLACLLVLYFVQFGLLGDFHLDGYAELTHVGNATYIALSRLAWGAALGWITVACIKGYGGFASTFLGAPVWIPLARVNYCAYLIHPIILTEFFSYEKTPFDITAVTQLFLFAAVTASPMHASQRSLPQTITYFLAAVVVLFVEAPLANLEKLLLK